MSKSQKFSVKLDCSWGSRVLPPLPGLVCSEDILRPDRFSFDTTVRFITTVRAIIYLLDVFQLLDVQGCKNITIFLTPKMVIWTFLSSYINILMDRLYIILRNCLLIMFFMCNLGVFTPNLYSFNHFWALNTTQMGQECYFFLNLPIEVKPSLVPLVPQYLSLCNPAWNSWVSHC